MFDALRNLLGLGGHAKHANAKLKVQPTAQAPMGAKWNGVQPATSFDETLQNSFVNPQAQQANLGLQGQFGVPDTSYSGGNDASAGFPLFLQDLLRRRY